MKVHREGVHHGNFLWPCADYPGQGFGELFVIFPPGAIGLKVAFHGQFLPVVHDLIHEGCSPFWLQAQGIPGEINDFFTLVFREIKCIPELFQRIRGIQLSGKGFRVFKCHANDLFKNTTECPYGEISRRFGPSKGPKSKALEPKAHFLEMWIESGLAVGTDSRGIIGVNR